MVRATVKVEGYRTNFFLGFQHQCRCSCLSLGQNAIRLTPNVYSGDQPVLDFPASSSLRLTESKWQMDPQSAVEVE